MIWIQLGFRFQDLGFYVALSIRDLVIENYTDRVIHLKKSSNHPDLCTVIACFAFEYFYSWEEIV